MVAAGPTVAAGTGHLTTWMLGDPDRPRLLLQHGVGSSTRFLLDAVAPPLVELGWCVVAADLRGHGGATPVRSVRDHTLDALVTDMTAAVTATGAVACGGVSLGAHAAAAAVGRGAVPAMPVLAVLPAAVDEVDRLGPHAAVAVEVHERGVVAMRGRLAAEPGLRPWLREVLLRDLGAHDDASLEAALLALPGAAAPTVADLVALPPGSGVVGWPDDPGHPLVVARAWATAAGVPLVTLSLDDVDSDPIALGRAAATALGAP